MNSIDLLKKVKNLDDLNLVASKVVMSDGSTVEENIIFLREELIKLHNSINLLTSKTLD